MNDMKCYTELTNLTANYKNIVIALGMFDGVHVGHQSIIKRAVNLAKSINGTAMVFSFSNHPLTVLAPPSAPPQIGELKLRQQKMAELGIDILMTIPFTSAFASITPTDFLAMLQQNFAPRYVVTGQNYTFGAGGRGTATMLMELGANYGFQAEICPDVTVNQRHVSSTRIRSLLEEGHLAAANASLGYPFTIIAEVIHGDERGRQLGFPTANLAIPPKRVMLPNGAYVTEVIYQDKSYLGLANIGDNPTFTGCYRRIEVNIQDFNFDIYGQEIEVRFLEHLRDEIRFAGVEALIAQLHNDKAAAQRFWQKNMLR